MHAEGTRREIAYGASEQESHHGGERGGRPFAAVTAVGAPSQSAGDRVSRRVLPIAEPEQTMTGTSDDQLARVASTATSVP
jgi:hypothetical protein